MCTLVWQLVPSLPSPPPIHPFRGDGAEGEGQDSGAGVQPSAGLCLSPLTPPPSGPAGRQASVPRTGSGAGHTVSWAAIPVTGQKCIFPPSLSPSLPRLQEKHTRERLRDHLQGVVALQAELRDTQIKLKEVQKLIRDANLRQQRMLSASTKYPPASVCRLPSCYRYTEQRAKVSTFIYHSHTHCSSSSLNTYLKSNTCTITFYCVDACGDNDND